MKDYYDEKLGCNVSEPETVLGAIECLETFFEADMWYAKGAEWKTEEDMLKYMRGHFDIFKEQIKRIIND